ncbi:hypothetical protein N7541_007983 [Penicillium brevicompactum]|uniref:Uncharacterized protein n=1 Tax=Penicillium brevicompactum TaxID=5074 RepID=A0A9W9QY73_PENBR|nr:uncharacterized protein N7506_003318 [Penicillium brevicompactum]KAJ5343494.1 hypothetical protein N7506_003318 [Penicillium brevicompactum]KAJ5350256.1 hypothetical protein N7541_007983 [Penicillium brevicompactum]
MTPQHTGALCHISPRDFFAVRSKKEVILQFIHNYTEYLYACLKPLPHLFCVLKNLEINCCNYVASGSAIRNTDVQA